jgi:hypothetical protein
VVKELADRHSLHEGGQPEAAVDGFADPGSEADVQCSGGLRGFGGGGHSRTPAGRLGHR